MRPEDDQFSGGINGVRVSDFVFMNWFTGGPGPYDFKGQIQLAREILPGGYTGALTFTNGNWALLLRRPWPSRTPGRSRSEPCGTAAVGRERAARIPCRGVRS
jgi:hypothetical protein